MTKILIISTNNETFSNISAILNASGIENALYTRMDDDEIFDFIKENNFGAVILDDEIETYSVIAKKIKNNENNIFTALLYDAKTFGSKDEDLSGFIDVFIQKPVNKNILIPTINSYLKIKKSMDKFREDNKELNKSLYQLDVLYNTSSKLSGNLDKEKLYEIMFETLEKTLSFDLASALIFPQAYENTENKLFVHSLKKPDAALLEVLKERIISCAKETNPDNDFSKVSTEEFIKPSYEHQTYDIKLLNSDKLTAPIKVKDRVFGALSIYRNKPFTKEDVVCFQSIIHQIASALRAVILYDEIKNANVELKKLERIKSEFVSIVSHELRTPLTPINLSLDFLASEDINPNAKKTVDLAKKNVTRLTGMIEDLLDLSRIETGKFSFEYKKYNSKTSLDLIQKTFEGQAKEKNINFKIIINEPLPDIYADSKRIDQILTNIANNAMKFTPNGGNITISANVCSAEDINRKNLIDPVEPLKGKYVHISIKDTGLGIKNENIHKIFNKFSQIENSLTRNAGGIGLGLTITKNFIDAHFGSIWVESEENKGSDFNVILPVFSDARAFDIDLNAAKKTYETTFLLTLKTNRDILDFVENLKKENIIKPVRNSKEVYFAQNGEFIYKIYLPNLQKSACDFITSRIEDFIKESNYKDCGIVLERALFRKTTELLA